RAARRIGALALAGTICLGIGFETLDRQLERARVDAGRAAVTAREGIRLADARVRSRRPGRWGDELLLVGVRAVDGGSPLPRRMQLRLAMASAADSTGRPGRDESLLGPGSSARLGLRISPLRGRRNPGMIDRERVAARRGVAARARLANRDWVVARIERRDPLWSIGVGAPGLRERLRARTAERWSRFYGGSALARGLALGDRSGLTTSTREAFGTLGLSHLLAVSGLHVGLVAGLAIWLGQRWARGIMPPGHTTLPVAIFCAGLAAGLYAWLSGGSVPARRALLVLACALVLRLWRRDVDVLTVLALVAAALLAREPALLFDLGPQLSFGSCLALWAGGVWTGRGRLERGAQTGGPAAAHRSRAFAISRVCDTLHGTLRASLAVGFGTAGIVASHGLPVAWAGAAANLCAIPWTALLALPASLAAVGWGALGLPEPLEADGLRILLWPAAALGRAAEWLAPLLPVREEIGVLGGEAIWGLGGLGLLAVRGGWTGAAMLVWVLLALLGAAPPDVAGRLGPEPRVVFLDVGQGDAALVQQDDRAWLIDTGPGPADGSGGGSLLRALRALGVDSIEVLILTHADLDHRGGAWRVLESLPVRELWLSAAGRGGLPLEQLAEHALRQGARVRWRWADGASERRGPLRFEVLWPPLEAGTLSSNDGSLVIALTWRNARLLFTGDIGARAERALLHRPEVLAADVLKVSHHGSRRSSGSRFLAAVGARLALISAPCEATRGLPSAVVLRRLQDAGAHLAWTGRDGAVAIRPGAAGSGIEVERWGPERSCDL
ncbi:MAG: ComEC/Rec2 family competence protein, partial [Deltaproteobacteria bacterium]|nr:ComEC/Rec2 family competence protein [Deltaproteobacteria bacterium]